MVADDPARGAAICKIDSIDGLELDFNMFLKTLFGMDGLEADFNMCWLNSLQTIAICQIVIQFDSILFNTFLFEQTV